MWLLFFVNTNYFILQFKYFKSNYFTRATYAHDCIVIMIKKYNILASASGFTRIPWELLPVPG